MEYFKKINLLFENRIREFVIADAAKQVDLNKIESQIRIKHKLPIELRRIINVELESIGLPKLLYCQSYIRQQENVQKIHIDGGVDVKINAAINIPISGTKGSNHNWYTGDYKLTIKRTGDLVFHHIIWNSEPMLATSLELDQPYLVRVNEPHSAVAGKDNRWIFTMRFVGNPTFESLYDILSTR